MKILYNPIFLRHETGMHPENPKRLFAFSDLDVSVFDDASFLLNLVHEKSYIQQVKNAFPNVTHLDADTVISEGSYDAAVAAVSATIEASESCDFALVRPPGHHAHPGHASGFCLFNNIAIATFKLVEEGNRVLIFDFDGHLGDGTSHIFYRTDQVMYWSLHQYPAFPGKGYVNEIGSGNGIGYTMNVPLPPRSGDDIFMDAFEKTLKIAAQFYPDIVAVSAGFDAYIYDLLLDLRVTQESFYYIGKKLKTTFQKVFAVLEGGYDVNSLPKCVYNFIAGINGEKMAFRETPTTSDVMIWETYENRLKQLLQNLAPHWR